MAYAATTPGLRGFHATLLNVNFLAHLWITDRAGLPLAGALLGDYLRGPVPADLPEALGQSVRLHRRVDACTDRHPVVVAARAGFADGPRRYAGILLDILFDHLLAKDWTRYSDEPLEGFAARAGRDIGAEQQRFAQAGGPAPGADSFTELLLSYASPEGIERAVWRTSQRLSRPQGLLDALEGWTGRLVTLESGLPELLAALELEAEPFAAQGSPASLRNSVMRRSL